MRPTEGRAPHLEPRGAGPSGPGGWGGGTCLWVNGKQLELLTQHTGGGEEGARGGLETRCLAGSWSLECEQHDQICNLKLRVQSCGSPLSDRCGAGIGQHSGLWCSQTRKPPYCFLLPPSLGPFLPSSTYRYPPCFPGEQSGCRGQRVGQGSPDWFKTDFDMLCDLQEVTLCL